MKKHIGRIAIVTTAWLAIGIFAFVVWQTHLARAEPLDTYHSSWHLVRESADEDGATFAAVYDLTTGGNFANKDSSTVTAGGPFRIVSRQQYSRAEGFSPGSRWMLTFSGKNFNNIDDTFSFNVVGWSKTNGMLQNIVEGSGVLGTQAVIVYPDGGDALGELASETAVAFTHGTKTFTVTNNGFAGVVVGMLGYVTGSNLTSGYYEVSTVTDDNTIIMIGAASANDNTDSTVQINPAFWADTLTLDETTKWPRDGDAANVTVYNSGDNEVALLVIELGGLEWVQVVIYDADAATGEEAGAISVYGRRY